MLKISSRRPSPALFVAIIALVAAFAGSAVALPGRGTVDKNDLKRGVVKSKNIKKNAVKSKHVKADALKGVDINESTLGTVPSATTAANLVGHTRFSAVIPEGEQAVATFGPFTLLGNCVIDDAGDDFAELYLTTSANNSAMDSNSGDEESDFDVGTEAFVLSSDTVSTGDPEIEAEDSAQLVTQAPDGSSFGVDQELLAINLPGQTAQCHFAGVIEKLS